MYLFINYFLETCHGQQAITLNRYSELRDRSIYISAIELNTERRILNIFEVFRRCFNSTMTLPINKGHTDQLKYFNDKFTNDWLNHLEIKAAGISQKNNISSEFFITILMNDREFDNTYFIKINLSARLDAEELKKYLSLDVDGVRHEITILSLILYHKSGFLEEYTGGKSYYSNYDAIKARESFNEKGR
jgi:hypothetical protein